MFYHSCSNGKIMTETILIHADSLALPRDGVGYDKTWPARLRERFPDTHVVTKAQTDNTTDGLHHQYDYVNRRLLEHYGPDIVVIQLGIADCAPRYFRRMEKAAISRLPGLLQRVMLFAGQRLRSRSPRRAYVPPEQFKHNLVTFLKRVDMTDASTVVLVNILSPSEKYETKNPAAPSSIEKYNEIINSVANQFQNCTSLRPLADDPNEECEISDRYTVDDGYHLSGKGHARLARRLTSRIARRKREEITNSRRHDKGTDSRRH